MKDVLQGLGVSPEIQAFFKLPPDLVFDYGDGFEHFSAAFHHIPTSQNIWFAGHETARQIIITHSAMEAVAFLSLNQLRHISMDSIAFVAIGSLPCIAQVEWIKQTFKKRKITLVFGTGLLAALTDIKMAASLRSKNVQLLWTDQQVKIVMGRRRYSIAPEALSLNEFETALGVRTGIRTRKPARHNSFLDQLKNEQYR